MVQGLMEHLFTSETLDVLKGIQSGKSLDKAELSGIDLSHACLDRGNFSAAYLRQARLKNASCCGVNLSNATLVLADLSGSCLADSELSGAVLTQACLDRVNLQRVRGVATRFYGARLDYADATHASLHQADFQNTSGPQARFKY